MPLYHHDSKAKSGVTLFVIFPLIALVFLIALKPIPVLGKLVSAAMLFGAPAAWIISATGSFHKTPESLKILALCAHYPIVGFLAGYLFPFEVAFTRACAARIALRCGICMLGVVVIGILFAIFALAHDS